MVDNGPEFLVVGHINKPHGTKGEVFVWPLTDHPGSTFAPGVVLQLGDESGDRPDPFRSPVEVETVRPFRRGFLVRFAGIVDRNGAELVRDLYLLRPFEEIERRAQGEVFYHELLEMQVETQDGQPIGRVVEVYEIRPHDMLQVEDSKGRMRLIPFSEQVIAEIDVDGRRLVIDPP